MSEVEKFANILSDRLKANSKNLEKQAEEYKKDGKEIAYLGLKHDAAMFDSFANCIRHALDEMKKNGS